MVKLIVSTIFYISNQNINPVDMRMGTKPVSTAELSTTAKDPRPPVMDWQVDFASVHDNIKSDTAVKQDPSTRLSDGQEFDVSTKLRHNILISVWNQLILSKIQGEITRWILWKVYCCFKLGVQKLRNF